MKAKEYWNPYLAGVVLGLVLLGAYLVAGNGLGATALPKRSLALVGNLAAPEWTAQNTVLKGYVAGGANMGFAAALARGCTSGQALSGGAALATGSWVFMLMVFGGGYAVAWFVRRQWI